MDPIFITIALVGTFLLIFILSPIYGIAFITAFRTLSMLAEIHLEGNSYGFSAEGFLTLGIIIAGVLFTLASKQGFQGILKWPFILFIVYCLLTIFATEDVVNFSKKLARLLGYFFLYLMVVQLSAKKENRKILNYAFVVSLLVTSLPAIYIYCRDPQQYIRLIFGAEQGLQNVGIMSKNNFGFYSCYLVFFLIYLHSAVKNHLSKLIILALFVLQAGMLVLSYTRSAWVAFFVAFSVLVLYSRKRARLVVPLLAMLVIGASLYSVLYYGAYQEITEKKQVGFSSLHFRTAYAWPASIKAFEQKPVMGWGLGNDLYALTTAAKLKNTSHNDYLLVLVETGIIGLTLYLLLLGSLLLRTRQSIRQARDEETRLLCVSALAMFVAYLVGAIGEHLLQTPGATGYIITVLGMAHGTLLATPDSRVGEAAANRLPRERFALHHLPAKEQAPLTPIGSKGQAL
jgi:O-antigen ligase